MGYSKKSAFTLVELLVVIAIIALLLAALLPAFSVVKKNARIAQTQSIFQSLGTGVESYRAEQSLGAGLPPSATDSPPANPQQIADPAKDAATDVIETSGAHLLAMALRGADGLGCPGFKPVRTPTDGWWNDTFNGRADCAQGGLYCVKDADGKEAFPRYGPYVDEKTSERAKSIKALAEKGRILNPANAETAAVVSLEFFTDGWDLPILYYKATAASNQIVGSTGGSGPTRGIYRQEDNGLITGTKNGIPGADWKGLDFGAGTLGEPAPLDDAYHYLIDAAAPAVEVTKVNEFLEVKNTFARYIVDPKIRTRITPAQKDSYLLISPGPDGIYGNSDDVTNWTRETN